MKKALIFISCALAIVSLYACAPLIGAGTGNPSSALPGLVEVSGTVKEIKQGLILIEQYDDQGGFMLRFSENTKWRDGVKKDIETGNRIKCLVKLEPTFTTPSQGEVYEVIENIPSD